MAIKSMALIKFIMTNTSNTLAAPAAASDDKLGKSPNISSLKNNEGVNSQGEKVQIK